MSAVFLRSYRYTVTANERPEAPAKRLLSPEPFLTYRSAGSVATINVDLGSEKVVDSLALTRAALDATNTIRVQVGTSAGMTSGVLYDQTRSAWNGAPPRDDAATFYLPFAPAATPLIARYVRVTITTTRPLVEVSRLLVGQRIEVDGIDQGPEMSLASGSLVDDGDGWTAAQARRSRLSWKCAVGNIRVQDAHYRWAPFLAGVGRHEGWLFIPDTDSAGLQQEAALVRQQQEGKITEVTYERRKVELQLLEC